MKRENQIHVFSYLLSHLIVPLDKLLPCIMGKRFNLQCIFGRTFQILLKSKLRVFHKLEIASHKFNESTQSIVDKRHGCGTVGSPQLDRPDPHVNARKSTLDNA